MEIIGITVALLLVGVAILAGLARAFQGNSVRELLDWKPTRSPEVEAQNEIDDVQQMIDAQNEYRRRRGADEITEADVMRQAAEDQAVRARGTGPFTQTPEVIDELEGGLKKLRPPKNPKPAPRLGSTAKPKTRAGSKAKPKPKPKRKKS